jgi:hypothetical protein
VTIGTSVNGQNGIAPIVMYADGTSRTCPRPNCFVRLEQGYRVNGSTWQGGNEPFAIPACTAYPCDWPQYNYKFTSATTGESTAPSCPNGFTLAAANAVCYSDSNTTSSSCSQTTGGKGIIVSRGGTKSEVCMVAVNTTKTRCPSAPMGPFAYTTAAVNGLCSSDPGGTTQNLTVQFCWGPGGGFQIITPSSSFKCVLPAG